MDAQGEFEASLFQEIRKVVEINNLVVIVGDFIYPRINWCDRRYRSPTSRKFIAFCEDIFLNQYIVEEITRGRNTLENFYHKWK